MDEAKLGGNRVGKTFRVHGLEEDEMDRCEICDSIDVVLENHDRSPFGQTAICKLCWGTETGWIEGRNKELSNNDVAKTICYVGNEILKEIRKLKES